MDLDVKDSNASDDDIIELTDIIETGSTKTAPEAPGESIDNLVSDLGNTGGTVPDIPSDAEADIDALLAQMDADTQPASPAPTSNAGENLGASAPEDAQSSEEPDTSDVDALLQSLDMPPQPAEGETLTDAGSPTPSDDSAEDMDALLESILDAPAPSKSPAPKIDVTDADTAPPAEAPAPDEAISDNDLDDIDAFLNEVSESAEPNAAVIDDLTNEITANDPVENTADVDTKTTQEVEASSDDNDILNDLDELLKSVDEEDKNFANQSSPEQADTASASDEIDLSDIDQIISDAAPDQAVVEVADIAEALLPEAAQPKGDTLSDTIMDAVSVITDTPDLTNPLPEPLESSANFEDVHTSGSRLEAMESLLQSQVAGQAELISRMEAVENKATPSNQEELITRFDELESLLKAQISNTENLISRLETLESATTPSEDLLTRIEALESSAKNDATISNASEELKLRIETLENAQSAASVATVESLNNTDNTNELSTHFETLENTLKDQSADLGEVVARYEDMEHMLKTQALNQEEMTTRLDALEKRIVNMEEKLTNDLENMAAKAAAKIIREEIAALLTGD